MHDKTDDRIQRALNEHKRLELEQRCGARFSFDDADAPPEVIGEWLDYVEEFERQFRNAGRTTVRAFTGNAGFPPPASLPPDRIPGELRKVLEFLAAHAITVHVKRTVPPAEAYRFILQELFEYEIDDVHIDGMSRHFSYEEFHPDDAAEATMYAGHFLYYLFSGDAEGCLRTTYDDGPSNSPAGEVTLRERIKAWVEAFLAGIAVFTGADLKEHECIMEGDCATVTFAASWTGLQSGTLKALGGAGTAIVRLKKTAEGWKVVSVECPGWESG